MANNKPDETNQPPTGKGQKRSLRAHDTGKPIRRAERWKSSIAGQDLDKAEGIGRAIGYTNGQLRETLGWPIGY